MGNYLIYTRPPETSSLSVAPMRTPFTDVTAPIGLHDGDECFTFQLRWIDCCEAHGRELAKSKCKYLFQDMIECSKMYKQQARVSDMMERRYHVWFKGITGQGPKVDLHHERPRYDGYAPNFLYDDQHYKTG